MLDLGQPWAGAVTIRDAAGTLADAGAVTLTITLPDGTTATPDVSHDGTGEYSATYTPTQAGIHQVSWVATGDNASALPPDIFDVRASSSIQLLSMDDAKATLKMSKTADDGEVRDCLDSVTSLIEDRIGPVVPRTVTEIVTGARTLALTSRPVTAITSITGLLSGALTINSSNVVFDPVTGIVELFNRTGFYNDAYTVVYTAGRGINPSIRQAARITLQHLWSYQRGATPTRAGDSYTAPFSLPNAAREYLDPYITPAVG